MQDWIYPVAAAAIFAIGLHGLFAHRHLLRKIIAANLAASAVFLFLLGTTAPPQGASADAIPQALVLTGIVISVSVTAFALALLRRLFDGTGRADLGEDE